MENLNLKAAIFYTVGLSPCYGFLKITFPVVCNKALNEVKSPAKAKSESAPCLKRLIHL